MSWGNGISIQRIPIARNSGIDLKQLKILGNAVPESMTGRSFLQASCVPTVRRSRAAEPALCGAGQLSETHSPSPSGEISQKRAH